MPPTVTWNEAIPPESEAFSLGDDRIRELKTQIREIFGTDHIMPSSEGSGDNWGYHNKVQFVEQINDPDYGYNPWRITLWGKEVSNYCELHMIISTGFSQQLTSNGNFVGGIGGVTNKEIRMWSGTLANIPAGWSLCDGSGSMPNLIGKFIQGISTASTNPMDNITLGTDDLVLTESTMPRHDHYMQETGTHTHTIAITGWAGSTNVPLNIASKRSTESSFIQHPSSHTHTASNTGSGQAIDNKPAYLELAFIARG